MGGGDLNTKKSWHPTNSKNQERVWKAEQKDAAEKKRLAELQREIQEERDREDLRNIARSSGYIEDDPNKKLEWMYKGQQLNREEYLTGRAIDKNFEELQASEAQQQHPGIQVPKNHVEHEVIPFSIRQYKGIGGTASEQVDMARKLMEDPLMLIKQKEIETRRKILENPVRLKELHKMLKKEKGKSGRKEKKKKHKRSRSSDEDLDKLLAQKYKKLQGVLQTQGSDEEDANLDKVLSTKYAVLSKELDKMTESKKKKKKRRRDSSSESDDFNVSKNSKKRRSRSRSPKRSPPRSLNRRRSPDRRWSPDRRRSPDRRSRTTPERRRSSPQSSSRRRSRSPRNRKNTPPRAPKPSKRDSSSSSSSSSSRDEDSPRPAKKNFGLVRADGKSLKLAPRRSPAPRSRAKVEVKKTEVKRSNPSRLTEEEIQERLKEMQKNASWREVERSEKVRRHREVEKREEEEEKKNFDKDFLNKQLKKTSNSMQTVESRIKSNLNNIQRSSRVMDTHFARR